MKYFAFSIPAAIAILVAAYAVFYFAPEIFASSVPASPTGQWTCLTPAQTNTGVSVVVANTPVQVWRLEHASPASTCTPYVVH